MKKLRKFIRSNVARRLHRNLLFDRQWYNWQRLTPASSFRDARHHYQKIGLKAGLSPHPLFSTEFYFSQRPDVRAAGCDPVKHFIDFGWREGAQPHPDVDIAFYLDQSPDLNGLDPLTHYLARGWKAGLRIVPDFDATAYLQQNPDVAKAGVEPVSHFYAYGMREGRVAPKTTAHSTPRDDVSLTAKWFGRAKHAVRKVKHPKITPEKLAYHPMSDHAWSTRNIEIFSSLRLKNAFSRSKSALLPQPMNLLAAKLMALNENEAAFSRPLSTVLHSDSATAGSLVERIASLGLSPQAIVDTPDPPMPTQPILITYDQERLEVSERFSFLAEAVGTVVGGPSISVVMPVYKPPLVYLERAIVSVLAQTYCNWEFIIVDDYSERPDISSLLEYYKDLDSRISVISCAHNLGISTATNLALDVAKGDFIAFLDHDDLLTRDALETMAASIDSSGGVDWLYSDECKIDDNDIAITLFPKPDWSPYLLFNCMYTGHLALYRRSVVDRVGRLNSEFDFSQDYDLALRIAEQKPKVVHVRKCLYGWRMIEGSAAAGGKSYARQTNIAALQAAINRRDIGGTAIPLPTANRVQRTFDDPQPLVSIIVPSDSVTNIEATIASIVSKSTYRNLEIIVVTRSDVAQKISRAFSAFPLTVEIYDKPYNFSDKCNAGFKRAKGEYVVFFNDDVRVISADWLEAVLECLSLPGVGVVGPKLLYEDGSIQHAGMVSGVRRLVGTAFHTFPAETTEHFNFAQSVREVSIVCGACLAMPSAVFREVDGFDSNNTPISHSDVDLCYRVRAAGYACIYTPHAKLTHIGHLSIGLMEKKKRERSAAHRIKDKSDIYLMKKWGQFCADDPYFPPGMRDILYIDSQEPFSYYPAGVDASNLNRDAVIFSHDLSRSGAPKIVFDMAECLISSGSFVVVISPVDGPMRHSLNELGAHVIVDPLSLTGDKNTIDLVKNFDVVIVNTAVCWPVVGPLSKLTDVLWYFHETELIRELADTQIGFVRSLADAKAVWCGSVHSARYLQPYLADKISILPYGVDGPDVDPTAFDASTKSITIAVLATIEQRKGQDLVVEAFLQLPDTVRRKAELRIVGRVNEADFFARLVARAQGECRIYFEEAVDLNTYRERLNDSDVVICASRDDTLPLVSLDALSAGKILVCSQETGTSQYIEDGVSGFVLATNSSEEIGRVITQILEDYAQLEFVSRKANETYQRFFTKERFASDFLNFVGLSDQKGDAAF
ncbi:hypothetical protein C6558_37905 [Ensifer sp. NM-2]|uniref:glycosyltransferase n=1 Tax=Ensifer sp. NM-2 TaxID=2109730 RepID=UPI000D130E43|nr:glycosyltransferase [Ensifer sp. NM-2]PSS59510.1 hypothetical protein C6558_37905 [Ensifer sp. NM-2]